MAMDCLCLAPGLRGVAHPTLRWGRELTSAPRHRAHALSCFPPLGAAVGLCVISISHAVAVMELSYPPRRSTLTHDAGGVPPLCTGTLAGREPKAAHSLFPSWWDDSLSIPFRPFRYGGNSLGPQTRIHTHIYTYPPLHTRIHTHTYMLLHFFIYSHIHSHSLSLSLCVLQGQSMDTPPMDVPIVQSSYYMLGSQTLHPEPFLWLFTPAPSCLAPWSPT